MYLLNPRKHRLGYSLPWEDLWFSYKRYYPNVLHGLLNIRAVLIHIASLKAIEKGGHYFSHLKMKLYKDKLCLYIFFYDIIRFDTWRYVRMARRFNYITRRSQKSLFQRNVWFRRRWIKNYYTKTNNWEARRLYLFMYYLGFDPENLLFDNVSLTHHLRKGHRLNKIRARNAFKRFWIAKEEFKVIKLIFAWLAKSKIHNWVSSSGLSVLQRKLRFLVFLMTQVTYGPYFFVLKKERYLNWHWALVSNKRLTYGPVPIFNKVKKKLTRREKVLKATFLKIILSDTPLEKRPIIPLDFDPKRVKKRRKVKRIKRKYPSRFVKIKEDRLENCIDITNPKLLKNLCCVLKKKGRLIRNKFRSRSLPKNRGLVKIKKKKLNIVETFPINSWYCVKERRVKMWKKKKPINESRWMKIVLYSPIARNWRRPDKRIKPKKTREIICKIRFKTVKLYRTWLQFLEEHNTSPKKAKALAYRASLGWYSIKKEFFYPVLLKKLRYKYRKWTKRKEEEFIERSSFRMKNKLFALSYLRSSANRLFFIFWLFSLLVKRNKRFTGKYFSQYALANLGKNLTNAIVRRPFMNILKSTFSYAVSQLSKWKADVKIYLLSNDEITASFIAKHISWCLKLGFKWKDVINPIRKDLKYQARRVIYDEELSLNYNKKFLTEAMIRKSWGYCFLILDTMKKQFVKTKVSSIISATVKWMLEGRPGRVFCPNFQNFMFFKYFIIFYFFFCKISLGNLLAKKKSNNRGMGSFIKKFHAKILYLSSLFQPLHVIRDRRLFIKRSTLLGLHISDDLNSNLKKLDLKNINISFLFGFLKKFFMKGTVPQVNFKIRMAKASDVFNLVGLLKREEREPVSFRRQLTKKLGATMAKWSRMAKHYKSQSVFGFKFRFVGRSKRRSRRSLVWYNYGVVPASTVTAYIDYGEYVIPLTYSLFSVRVWIYKNSNSNKFHSQF